ncbi:ABC transporter ATP-binding protein [Actinomadura bangladeshensis]|uniref:ABC transporter ATP-binding protein n=1 Tax=Actinomadura bangladeshensis TaxID=453573 RepID=A0A6L9QVZ6_9ACTN|nr:ABC transporter ATP-binding protein [Actinomadura bangladeshensis]NEA29551.1 ABC transporter ATP-binding protein [Actinomadura bangladeshensis]
MEAAVHTTGLRRVYKRGRKDPVVALDDLTLAVEPNEIHGLLGPNGAGKTTLVKILSTVLLPSGGSARILGRDVVADTRAVRSLVGLVLGGDRGLYDRLSARRNLLFWGALYRLDARTTRERADALLERVGLADRADDRVERFSRGMRQRLHLARGLLHEPRVLFLDEPTSGLDPVAAGAFRRLVLDLRAEGRTFLLATHDMDEATALCDRVTLIDRGRMLLSADTARVGRFLGERECVDFTHPDPSVADGLALLPDVSGVERRDGAAWRVHTAGRDGTRRVLAWLLDRDVLTARRGEPTLEEVYLRAVGDRGMRV